LGCAEADDYRGLARARPGALALGQQRSGRDAFDGLGEYAPAQIAGRCTGLGVVGVDPAALRVDDECRGLEVLAEADASRRGFDDAMGCGDDDLGVDEEAAAFIFARAVGDDRGPLAGLGGVAVVDRDRGRGGEHGGEQEERRGREHEAPW